MSNHTKGKWTLKDGANNLYRDTIEADPGCFQACCQEHFTLYGPKPNESQFVADIIVQESDEGRANAKRIVHAVNNYDDLVNALGAIIDTTVDNVKGFGIPAWANTVGLMKHTAKEALIASAEKVGGEDES